jgi:hypothetical protein
MAFFPPSGVIPLWGKDIAKFKDFLSISPQADEVW